MEKRLFLAIGLSLMIVWLWSLSAPRPDVDQKQQLLNKALPTEELDKGSVKPPSIAVTPALESQPLKETVEERIETLDSGKLTAEFSNIGGALNRVTVDEYNAAMPIEHIANITGYEHVPFTLDNINDKEISYSFEDSNFIIKKSYAVHDKDYIIESKVEFYNKSNHSKTINASGTGYIIEMSNLNESSGEEKHTIARDKALFEYAIYSENGIHRKAGAHKFHSKEDLSESGRVFWAGFRDRYFCAIIAPQYDTRGYNINVLNENQLKVTIDAEESPILPGMAVNFNSIIYVGPERLDILKEYKMGFEKIKRYYRFGLFDGIAKIIGSMMEWIHGFVPNWGVCIILISAIIYFSMYPLTFKGMQSMKKMQAMQPMIAKLKEKYKDNPQKMNKEMMELYKTHKVNPLGGCLPMLLQMPVFIGLYQVLWRSVSFKGAKFLWIKDLSEPDRLFLLPWKLPFFGNEFNLLPLIMIIVMFFQQKLSAKSMVVTDPSQAAQQKMMTTIMPVFIGFIFYKFASGLTLYFTMFYLFSTFTQWKMSKVKKGA